MSDPIRLKDDRQALPALRDDLDRVQGLAPHAYDTSAGLARLHSGIAASASGALKTGVWRVLWPSVTVVGLVSATWFGYTVMQRDRAPRPQVAVRSTPAATIQPTPIPAIAQVVRPEPSIAEHTELRPTESSNTIASDPDALLRLETAHLARARTALEQSPAEARRLAQQGQRRFATGMFGQEREAIIVLSSLRLHQASAEAAARAFLDRYPHSSLSDRIRQEMARGTVTP